MVARQRTPGRQLDGVLLLDKPQGMTSNAALQAARRLYGAAKAGHSGTLDPLATGLLPVLFGEATKFGAALLDADKTYVTEIALGTTTTTGDAEGEVVERRTANVTERDVAAALARFRGPIAQVPPMYSALKRDGRPLYAYARAGTSVERAPRTVTIHALSLDAFAGDRLKVTVHCSKGTYIRVLAEDIGRALGCGAHVAALRRTAIGHLRLAEAVTLDALAGLASDARDALLRPADAVIDRLPRVQLAPDAADRFAHGQAVAAPQAAAGAVRVYRGEGAFLGTGTVSAAGALQPVRLVRSAGNPCESH
jgi:tRNA pseudouridine55 synthase